MRGFDFAGLWESRVEASKDYHVDPLSEPGLNAAEREPPEEEGEPCLVPTAFWVRSRAARGKKSVNFFGRAASFHLRVISGGGPGAQEGQGRCRNGQRYTF